MRTVRYADRPDQAWRNGGGVTRELFRDERWRLSVATISAPGAFSAFPGLDRVFVVARGSVELTVAGRLHRLSAGELLHFAGEDAVSAVPEGVAMAVNVMVTRPLQARVRVVGRAEVSAMSPVAVVDLATLDAYLMDAMGVAAKGVPASEMLPPPPRSLRSPAPPSPAALPRTPTPSSPPPSVRSSARPPSTAPTTPRALSPSPPTTGSPWWSEGVVVVVEEIA